MIPCLIFSNNNYVNIYLGKPSRQRNNYFFLAHIPGGSFSNIMAVNLARYRLNPGTREKGMFESPQMRIYSSCEVRTETDKNTKPFMDVHRYSYAFRENRVIAVD